MSEERQTFREHLINKLTDPETAEGIQKYILGYKKSGQPRAAYDVIKDYTIKGKKKKKKYKGYKGNNTYIMANRIRKAKKKKRKKYWKI